MKLLRDTWLVLMRSFWLTLNFRVWFLLGLAQPFVYLLLFGPLLVSVARVPGFPEGGAYNVFVPGLLIQLAMYGLFSGFSLLAEMRFGVVERWRVTPISRSALLFGRALRDIVVLWVQAAVMLAVSVPFGLTIELPSVAAVFVLLALIGLVVGSFSYTMALWLRNDDALAQVTNAFALPAVLLSGILLPMSLAPDWLRVVSSFNPFSHAVTAARQLFGGRADGPEVALGIGMMALLALGSVWLATRAFNRAAP